MPHRGRVMGLVCHHRQRLREQAGHRRSQAGCVLARGQQAIDARMLQGSKQAWAKGDGQDSRVSSVTMTARLPIGSVPCQKVKRGRRKECRRRGRRNSREVDDLGVGEGRSNEKDEEGHNRDRERHRRAAIVFKLETRRSQIQAVFETSKNNFIRIQCG